MMALSYFQSCFQTRSQMRNDCRTENEYAFEETIDQEDDWILVHYKENATKEDLLLEYVVIDVKSKNKNLLGQNNTIESLQTERRLAGRKRKAVRYG